MLTRNRFAACTCKCLIVFLQSLSSLVLFPLFLRAPLHPSYTTCSMHSCPRLPHTCSVSFHPLFLYLTMLWSYLVCRVQRVLTSFCVFAVAHYPIGSFIYSGAASLPHCLVFTSRAPFMSVKAGEANMSLRRPASIAIQKHIGGCGSDHAISEHFCWR